MISLCAFSARADFIDLYANPYDVPQNKAPRLGRSSILLIPVQIDAGKYQPIDMDRMHAFFEGAYSGGALTFLNGDGRAHQIYSPECPELDSTLLQPGQFYRAALGIGPKVCHYQDLLAPAVAAYAGTVEVRRPPRDPHADDAAG